MNKKLISILILTFCTTTLFAVELGSKLDIGLFYHPSITLDDSSDLPVYSSMSSSYDFTPLYLQFNKHQIGAFLSIFHVSKSIVYQNIYLRDFSAFGIGLDYGYLLTDNFRLNSKISMGIGKLGQSLNKEMYASLAIIPSYVFIDEAGFDFSLNLIVNVIYRKYLLSPTVGLGFSTSLDWLTKYIKETSNN